MKNRIVNHRKTSYCCKICTTRSILYPTAVWITHGTIAAAICAALWDNDFLIFHSPLFPIQWNSPLPLLTSTLFDFRSR